MQIEFFFDIGSPYSYLAATQIDAIGQRTSLPVRWPLRRLRAGPLFLLCLPFCRSQAPALASAWELSSLL